MNASAGKMPVLFIGHGSPMNAIEANQFTEGWEKIASEIPRPKAILSISAHWYTDGTRITDSDQPRTVYDMYGFPHELYEVAYPAEGSPETARLTKGLIQKEVKIDNSWGCDHGTWSVLCRMYPKADIPVLQLSVDRFADAEAHFELGREIRALREKEVLIFGSGNVVHNLSRISWDMQGGYPWAGEFDNYVKEKISQRKYGDVIHYQSAGQAAKLAFTAPDHYAPLLYVLGASSEDDRLTVFNDSCTMGSLSMTSYLFR